MKKIMHFIHGMTMGGAENLVKDYLLNFDQRNYELILLVLERHNSIYEKMLKDNNIRVIYIDSYLRKTKNIFSKIYNHIKRYILVKKIIAQEDPDILHYHLPVDSYIRYAKPSKNTKIFSTIHSEPERLYNKSLKRKKEYKAAKWLVKNYNLRFICLQNDMVKKINEMFDVSNSIVLNNGIDLTKFNNPQNKYLVRKKLNIPEGSLVIGHVGRFHDVKNHEFLIKIFNEIYIKNKNAFLLMIGTGETKNNVISQLTNYNLDNRYLILENRTDIPDLMNAMDYFIFPSKIEGLGISIIEAQEMKLPCFKSENVPDYAVISNLVTTISLNNTPEEWANEILKYKYPKKIIVNDKDWDIREVVNKLEKIYEGKL